MLPTVYLLQVNEYLPDSYNHISFNAVSFSGSNELLGLFLFSYLTEQVSHPQFPTEQQATHCILIKPCWISTIMISINEPLHPQWATGAKLSV